MGMYHDGTRYAVIIENRATRAYLQVIKHSENGRNVRDGLQISRHDRYGLTHLVCDLIEQGQLQIFHQDGKLTISGFIPNREHCRHYPAHRGVKVFFQYDVSEDALEDPWDVIAQKVFNAENSFDQIPQYEYYCTDSIETKIKETGKSIERKINADCSIHRMMCLPFDSDQYDMISCGLLTYKGSSERVELNRPRPVSATKFTYCSNRIIYYNSSSLYIYRLPEQDDYPQNLKRIKTIKFTDPIVDVKFSPDGTKLLVISKSKIYIYQDFKLIKVLNSEDGGKRVKNSLKFCAWAKDGLTFGVCSTKFIQVWDVDY